jgi:hypothetical protein
VELSVGKTRQWPKFTVVPRICAPCTYCNCAPKVRGVLVELEDGFTFYYCNACVRALEEAVKRT